VVALLALALQAIAISSPLDSSIPTRLLFVASYLLLFVFVGANLPRPGIALIALGLLLNFLVIVPNGGLMPISTEIEARTGDTPAGVETGDWIPGSKNVLVARDEIVLYPLSDRITWAPDPVRAFSIGDVFLAAGLVVMLADLFLPRVQRSRQPEQAIGTRIEDRFA
jgi:hypothetical protein